MTKQIYCKISKNSPLQKYDNSTGILFKMSYYKSVRKTCFPFHSIISDFNQYYHAMIDNNTMHITNLKIGGGSS